jgi:hypothetical protein
MALDHLIAKAREHFKISKAEDWAKVRPEWVLRVPGCGPETLNHLRLYLIPHGITLLDDATPEFWASHLGQARIGAQIADGDTLASEAFTILIDTAEQQPWTFSAMRIPGGEFAITPIRFQHLGPSHGDYSLAGCEGEIHIERKSVEDAIGTFLSHGVRRERWIETLRFLAEIPSGSVAIEGTLGMVLGAIQARGRRPVDVLRRTFFNQVHAWEQDYMVPFRFYDSRRLAERGTYYLLRRYWYQKQELAKRSAEVASVDDVIKSICG